MTPVPQYRDTLGPAKVIQVHVPALGVLVVDNIACGPGIGGLLMAPRRAVGDLAEARVRQAMSLRRFSIL